MSQVTNTVLIEHIPRPEELPPENYAPRTVVLHEIQVRGKLPMSAAGGEREMAKALGACLEQFTKLSFQNLSGHLFVLVHWTGIEFSGPIAIYDDKDPIGQERKFKASLAKMVEMAEELRPYLHPSDTLRIDAFLSFSWLV